jgi:hypothetical protein
MKTNYPLQKSIGCQNEGQKTLLAALILQSALRDSPPVLVRSAVKPVVGKRAIPGYAGFAGSTLKTAIQNTTGYAIGAIFPGRPGVAAQVARDGYAAVVGISELAPSPAYAIGVQVPAYPAVPARTEQLLVVPVAEVTAVTSPAVTAIKGWHDAITIEASETQIIITADLPVASGVGIVGSSKTVISEITPSALQANAWVAQNVYALGEAFLDSPEVATLEQYFYNHAVQCNHVVTDLMRSVGGFDVPCKHLVITLYPSPMFDPTLPINNQLVNVFSDPVNQGS